VKHGYSKVVSWFTYQTSPVGALFTFPAPRLSRAKTRLPPDERSGRDGARRPLPGPKPTHVAVALKYDRGTMAAPALVAKGYDAMAQRIKEIAREHGVPMAENIPAGAGPGEGAGDRAVGADEVGARRSRGCWRWCRGTAGCRALRHDDPSAWHRAIACKRAPGGGGRT
jgi:hypothetical protein